MEESTIIDTPEGIRHFHRLQLMYALRLQAKSGIKLSRGSVIQQVNKEYGTTFRTAKSALAFMEKEVAKHDPCAPNTD